LTRHMFLDRGLHRGDAGTGNPAFVRLVLKLGWRIEGVLRRCVCIGAEWLDWTLVAQLRDQFEFRGECELVKQ